MIIQKVHQSQEICTFLGFKSHFFLAILSKCWHSICSAVQTSSSFEASISVWNYRRLVWISARLAHCRHCMYPIRTCVSQIFLCVHRSIIKLMQFLLNRVHVQSHWITNRVFAPGSPNGEQNWFSIFLWLFTGFQYFIVELFFAHNRPMPSQFFFAKTFLATECREK